MELSELKRIFITSEEEMILTTVLIPIKSAEISQRNFTLPSSVVESVTEK